MATRRSPDELLGKIRDICLTFPEAVEQETWGHPTFRVRRKIFATCGAGDDGRTTMTTKADPDEHHALLAVGQPFFLPAYVGTKGWIGINIDGDTDWTDVAELVTTSYRLIAPKRLSSQVTGPPEL